MLDDIEDVKDRNMWKLEDEYSILFKEMDVEERML